MITIIMIVAILIAITMMYTAFMIAIIKATMAMMSMMMISAVWWVRVSGNYDDFDDDHDDDEQAAVWCTSPHWWPPAKSCHWASNALLPWIIIIFIFYHGGDHYDVDPLAQIFSKHCNVRNNSQVLSLGQTCPNPNQFPGRPMAGSNHRCLFSSKSDPKISDRPETPNTCPDKICSQQPPPEFGFGDWVKEDSYWRAKESMFLMVRKQI